MLQPRLLVDLLPEPDANWYRVVQENENSVRYPVRELTTGVYILSLTSKNGRQEHHKFIWSR